MNQILNQQIKIKAMHRHFVSNGFHLLCIQSVFLMHLLLLLQMGIARCRSRLAQNLAWQPSVKAHICVVFFLESATFLHYFVCIHIYCTRVVFEVGQTIYQGEEKWWLPTFKEKLTKNNFTAQILRLYFFPDLSVLYL